MSTSPDEPEEVSLEELLGNVAGLLQTERGGEAVDLCGEVLRPFAPVLHACGVAKIQARDPVAALPFLATAAALVPGDENYSLSLARALVLTGKLPAARASLEELLRTKPACAEAEELLGAVLLGDGRPEAAIPPLRRALALNENAPVAWATLGGALLSQGLLHEALRAYKRSLELNPANTDLWDDLATTLQQIGEHVTAREAARRAPSRGNPVSMLLLSNAEPGVSAAAISDEHRLRARQLVGAPHATSIKPPRTRRQRRLRIGYVSADLRDHSVAFFVAPILANHDRRSFETYCYYTGKAHDGFTSAFATMSEHWREAARMTDDELVAAIRNDDIDILVDLAGFTAGGRVRALARRPAPINVGYIGYPNTRGLAEFDYFISDECADPPGMTEHLYEERLLRLPVPFLCYRPPMGLGEPERPPAARPITFGCFNAHWKLNPPLLKLWARIMKQVPQARLMLKARGFADGEFVAEVAGILASYGVEPARFALSPWEMARPEHLARYQEIDIALDTYPYHGTTTTCEALWQGVPVVTLAGDRHASRVGASILTALDLPELIASSPDDYVERAVAIGSNPGRLRELQLGVRSRLLASRVVNEAAFIKGYEAALLDVWSTYLKSTATNPSTPHSGAALAVRY